MNKIGKLGLLLVAGVFLISVGLYLLKKERHEKKEMTESHLIAVMHSKVLETIKYSQDIPGLKSEEFSALKNEISKIWDTLVKDSMLEMSGLDKDVRPYFVALQGIIEHVLASELQKEVAALKGFIHTPLPATPLCTRGDISKELVDPSLENDPLRLFTIKARATIIRDYLFKGGDLYIVYPKIGLTRRTEEQQKIYQQELSNYPSHLFDVPLNCENISHDLVGATYFFQDQEGKTFVFAIKMTQAKDPKDLGNFALWFGPINHPSIQKRIRTVSNYIEQSSHLVLSLQ